MKPYALQGSRAVNVYRSTLSYSTQKLVPCAEPGRRVTENTHSSRDGTMGFPSG